MRYRFGIVAAIAALVAVMASCDAGIQGNFNENLPPKTYLTIESVNLPEGERLVSQISVSWWGDDPDGYVTGYEFRIGNADQTDWQYTTRTDSVFVLPIPPGDTEADVRFTVRAIDSEGARDPNPPSVVFPIRNSPPEIAFNTNQTPPDTTFRVASFGWNVSDPDGQANLNRTEIALNDTSVWYTVPVEIDFITIRVDDTLPQPEAEVFFGRALLDSDIVFGNVNMDGTNRLFVRAFDNAEAVSQVISHEWHVKKQRSRVLFLNDIENPDAPSRVARHLNLLRLNGIDVVDYIDISDGNAVGGNRVPFTSAFPDRSLAAPTTNMMLAEWDHIYWVSDNLDRNIGYALEMTLEFFRNGGTMFIAIPTKRIPDDNPLLEFLPFERMAQLPPGQQSFILQTNSKVTPDASIVGTGAPELTIRRNLLSYYPIVPFGGSVILYNADFRTRTPFGTSEFAGSKVISVTNPEKNILYFGIDFIEFTADSDLEGLIRYSVIETLGFEQQ
jgi:hypothetical protein